jgi:hypothetical protein
VLFDYRFGYDELPVEVFGEPISKLRVGDHKPLLRLQETACAGWTGMSAVVIMSMSAQTMTGINAGDAPEWNRKELSRQMQTCRRVSIFVRAKSILRAVHVGRPTWSHRSPVDTWVGPGG